jgi:hypothetical protein
MNARVKMTAGALALLLAGAVAVVAMQYNSIAQLRDENQALMKDADEAQELAKENAEIPQLRGQAAEVEKLRAENRELPGLRSQAGQLRRQAADLDKLRAENQRLQAQLKSGTAPGEAAALPPDFITRDALRDMGQSTPENAIQTMFWAMTTGNINRIVQCSLNYDNPSDPNVDSEALGRELVKQYAAFPGFRIAEKTNLAPDEVEFGLQSSPGGVVLPRKLKLEGGLWRLEAR